MQIDKFNPHNNYYPQICIDIHNEIYNRSKITSLIFPLESNSIHRTTVIFKFPPKANLKIQKFAYHKLPLNPGFNPFAFPIRDSPQRSKPPNIQATFHQTARTSHFHYFITQMGRFINRATMTRAPPRLSLFAPRDI